MPLLFVNTKRIGVQRHAARAGAIKGAWESDAFACRFGRRRRRQCLLYYRELSLVHFLLTYISHTYAGQALLRVRGRAMDLRTDLDGGKHNLVLAEKRCGEVT